MNRGNRLVMAGTVGTLIIGFATFGGSASPPEPLPECPFHLLNADAPPTDVGPIADIPEFHDCQGFDVNGRYQGPYAVYSLFEQNLVWRRVQAATATARPNKSELVLAAVVRNLGGPYRPLQIEPGYNCVYLFTEQTRLKGWIRANGTDNDCPNRLPAETPTPNPLYTTHDATSSQDLYPEAARWERDPNRGTYLIGVYCNGWCVLGPEGFTHPSGYRSDGLPIERRVFEQKGWFDQQELARPSANPAQGVQPSTLRGIAFPHADLHTYKETDFAAEQSPGVGAWKEAASVSIPVEDATYSAKLHLKRAPISDPARKEVLNRVFLCKGTREFCRITDSTVQCPPTVAAPWAPGETDWWARFDPPAGGPSKYRCVVRRKHPEGAKHVPGTVRWRWKSTDETIWMRCGQGCCEVDA